MDPMIRPDVEPPAGSDEDGFTILSAAEPGPIPDDLQRELRELADDVRASLEDRREGVIGTRFGRRILVAPVDNPTEAVDIADVDIPRSMLLTMGGKDPGPEGALLAQVLFLRRDAVVGYARAPEVEGPTMPTLEQLLPGLRGSTACRLDEVGVISIGRQPSEVASGLEGLSEVDEGEDVSVSVWTA